MKKILPIIGLFALFLIFSALKDKLKDQGIHTPRLEMGITNVPKDTENVILIIGLGLLAVGVSRMTR